MLRVQGQEREADKLKEHCRLGLAACDLSPMHIGKQKLESIQEKVTLLYQGGYTVPVGVWLAAIVRHAHLQIDIDEFDAFVTTIRPWKHPSDSPDPSIHAPMLSAHSPTIVQEEEPAVVQAVLDSFSQTALRSSLR